MKAVKAKVPSKNQTKLPAAGRIRAERTQSPFAAYAGMGNPGIPSGKGAAVRWVRRLRRS